MDQKKNVLFVCVENAGRSQMAEVFFNKYAPDSLVAKSAGTKPSSLINPLVVQVMQEVGIDLSGEKPKVLSQKMIWESKKTVNMGCMDKNACPALFTQEIVDWKIPDPKGKTIEEIRTIRDQIEVKIKDLVSKLKDES